MGQSNVEILIQEFLMRSGAQSVHHLHNKSTWTVSVHPLKKNYIVTGSKDGHNNFVGRWLTCFRAVWHPQQEDMFVTGSMAKPRRILIQRPTNQNQTWKVRKPEYYIHGLRKWYNSSTDMASHDGYDHMSEGDGQQSGEEIQTCKRRKLEDDFVDLQGASTSTNPNFSFQHSSAASFQNLLHHRVDVSDPPINLQSVHHVGLPATVPYDIRGHQSTNLPTSYLSSTVEESDFSHIVESLEPDDLQHLFPALGILKREVKRIEARENTTDVVLKGKAVLGFWKQQNGRDATYNALLGAFGRCKFNNAKEMLEDHFKQKYSDQRHQITTNSFSAQHHAQHSPHRIEPIPDRHYAPLPQQPYIHSKQPLLSGISPHQSAVQYTPLDRRYQITTDSLSAHHGYTHKKFSSYRRFQITTGSLSAHHGQQHVPQRIEPNKAENFSALPQPSLHSMQAMQPSASSPHLSVAQHTSFDPTSSTPSGSSSFQHGDPAIQEQRVPRNPAQNYAAMPPSYLHPMQTLGQQSTTQYNVLNPRPPITIGSPASHQDKHTLHTMEQNPAAHSAPLLPRPYSPSVPQLGTSGQITQESAIDRRSHITTGSFSSHHGQQQHALQRIEPNPAQNVATLPQHRVHSMQAMQPSASLPHPSAAHHTSHDPTSSIPSGPSSFQHGDPAIQRQRAQQNQAQNSTAMPPSYLHPMQALGQQSTTQYNVLNPNVPLTSLTSSQQSQHTMEPRPAFLLRPCSPQSRTSGQQTQESAIGHSCQGFDLEVCKQELVRFYKSEKRKVQLLPWCDETRDMDEIYVTLKLKDGRKRGKHELKKNEDLVTLQIENNTPATRILLKGVAGSGKSTLLVKLAYSWAQQSEGSPFDIFKLLFILSLREIEVGCSLIDALFQQIFERTTRVSKAGLKNYIESHPEDIILLLDGFDEFAATDLSAAADGSLEEILSNRALRQCRTILSTRPHKDLQITYQSKYLVVNVLGFSKRNTELYMKKYFGGNSEKFEGLKQKLKESSILTALSHIPVLLMLMCLLWEDNQQLPDTQSKLYQEFVLFLWRKYWRRKGQDINCDDKSDEERIKEPIFNLGKVAFDGICPNEKIENEQIVFSESDFDKRIFHLGCETGLLTREKLRSQLKRYSSITFLHKSFQEFCAAKYLASLCDTQSNEFHTILIQLSTWQLFLSKFEMVKFCCGLVDTQAVVSILKHAISLYTKDNKNVAKIRVGYNKPESTRKHVIPILTLLYESSILCSDWKLNEAFEAYVNITSSDKSTNETESSTENSLLDSETITSHQSSDSHEVLSSLIQSFKSVFPDEGLELDISYNNKLSTSIFNNFIKSDFASKVLSTIKSVSVINLSKTSLSAMNGIFKQMSHIENVKFIMKSDEVDVLCQLLQSITEEICLKIVFDGCTITIDTIMWLVSNLKHLKSLKLNNVDLIPGKLHAEDAIQKNQIIKVRLLQYTNTDEAKGLGSSDAGTKSQTLKEANICLDGNTDSYGNDLLCQLLSFLNKEICLDIVFDGGIITIDTNVWLVSNLKHLKSLKLKNVDLIPGKSHAEDAIQKNQIIKVSLLKYTSTDKAKGLGSSDAGTKSQTLKEARVSFNHYTDSYGNDLLCQLLSSLNKDIGLEIVFDGGRITIDSTMWLVSNLKHLKSLELYNVDLIPGKSHAEDAIQNNQIIKVCILKYTNTDEAKELGSYDEGSKSQTLKEANIVLDGYTDPYGNALLCQLLTFFNKGICLDIKFKRGRITIDTTVWLVSNLKHLKSFKLDNVDLIPGNSHAVDAIQKNPTDTISIHYTITDKTRQLRSSTDTKLQTPKKAKISFVYCYKDSYGDDLLCQLLLSLDRDIFLDIEFDKGKITIDTMVWLVSNLEHLKSLKLNGVRLIPGKSRVEHAIENNPIQSTSLQHTKKEETALCRSTLGSQGKVCSEATLSLSNASNLEVLEMVRLEACMAIELFRQLLKHCTKLHTLRFQTCELKKDHIQIISKLLFPNASNLQALDLSHTTMGKTVRPHAEQLQHCTKLRTLSLSQCNLQEDQIQLLSGLFLSQASYLQELDLSNNTVGKDVQPLAEQLQHCTKLHTLKLRDCQLKEHHITILSGLFLSKASNLQVLDLSYNTVGMAAEPLAKQLQHCTKLHTLNLSLCKLNEDHCKVLIASFLSHAPNLQELILSTNTVGTAMGQLNQCTKLVKLGLFDAHLKNQGVIELAQRFTFLSNLTYLNIWENNTCITNTGFDAVFRHIHYLTKLEKLDISGHVDNQCSDLVKKCLAAAGERIPLQGKNRIDINTRYFSNGDRVQAIKNAAMSIPPVHREKHMHRCR